MKRMNSPLKDQSGIALITVILIVAILAAATLEINRAMRTEIYAAANISDGIRLTCMAKSGFYGAAALMAGSGGAYDTLREDWANAEILSAQSSALFAGGSFLVRMEDEQGKIPLHKLVSEGAVNMDVRDMMMRLLQTAPFGLDERRSAEIVDAVIDWMDANEEITGLGAESSYYASLPAPYAAKNGPLDCIEELLMVRGMTSELFFGTKDRPALGSLLTIYGTGKIHINTAHKVVLRALSPSMTAELADKMDEYRRKPGSNLSGADWYRSVSGMENVTIKPELIDVGKSNYFRIDSIGAEEKMEQGVTGIIARSPLRILSWRQN